MKTSIHWERLANEARADAGYWKEEARRLEATSTALHAALEDAEFLLRKAGQLAGPMQDSFNRSAADARAAIAKAKGTP